MKRKHPGAVEAPDNAKSRDKSNVCLQMFLQKNWAETPLGPVETWPPELRSAIMTLLRTPAAGCILVGKPLYTIYNNGYATILGGKHPQALGRPIFDIWPEAEPAVGSMLRGVVNNHDVYELENMPIILERPFMEETYFTLNYSPVLNAAEDEILAAWCITHEATKNVVGERRLATLRELADCNATSMSLCLQKVMEALERNRKDFPFAGLYSFSTNRSAVHLMRSFGTTALPATVVLSSDGRTSPVADTWKMTELLTTGKAQVICDVIRTRGELTREPWNVAPDVVHVLPLRRGDNSRNVSDDIFAILLLAQHPFAKSDDASFAQFVDAALKSIYNILTSVHSLEQQKDRADQLAKLNEAKSSFFNNVSHEFRTPLTLILGALESLGAQKELEHLPEAQTSLKLLRVNGNRLLQMVNNLLEFSSFEVNSAASVFEPVDLPSFSLEVASNFTFAMTSAGLKFSVHNLIAPSQSPIVLVDRAMWEKTILNLMANAIKYTPRGGTIDLLFRVQDSHFEFQIKDSGIGIPQEALPHLFERFFRVEKHHGTTQEGTGLGLALVKEYVQRHKGTIKVQSEIHKGTTFTITLPAGAASVAPSGTSSSHSRPSPVARVSHYAQQTVDSLNAMLPDLDGTALVARKSSTEIPVTSLDSRPRILVVDDNSQMRNYIAQLLQTDYNVRVAVNGQHALESIKIQKPDLLITDAMMPVMTGQQLVDIIRADASLSELPVIMVSAKSTDTDKVHALEKGADDYVTKPFSSRELFARVQAVLERTQMRISLAVEREANRTKDRFLAVLSHELRTPLTPVLMIAENMSTNETLPSSVREEAELIVKSVQLEIALIDDLLDWTRVKQEKLLLKESRVDVHDVVQQAYHMLHSAASAKRQNVFFHLESTLRYAIADAVRVQQVLLNVIRNAIKFTPDSGSITLRTFDVTSDSIQNDSASGCPSPPLRASIAETLKKSTANVLQSAKNGLVGISVTDTGVGIAAEMMPQLFHAFEQDYRLRSSELGGLGLGLFISKALVDRMKGAMIAESAGIGTGSRFTILLPAASREQLEKPNDTVTANHNESHTPLKQLTSTATSSTTNVCAQARRVLLVEDNKTTIRILQRLLQERLGYEVSVASTMAEALRLAHDTSFDLLLSDIGLPDGTGWELIAKLRAQRTANPHLKAIALSGYGMEEDIKRSLEAGFVQHLTKPIRFAVLQSAISAALQTA